MGGPSRRIDLTAELRLTYQLNKAYLPVMNTQQLLYVLVELTTEAVLTHIRMPINLSLVLHAGDYVTEEKLRCLREAMKVVVDSLGPQDIMSIVTCRGDELLIASGHRGTNKTRLMGHIDQMESIGGMSVSQSMECGLAELEKHSAPHRVSWMLLLTDGRIIGDEDKFKNLAEEAIEQDIVIDAVILGDDYDEELLDSITTHGFNSVYVADVPQGISEIALKTVQSKQGAIIQNAQMLLHLGNGITPRQVWQVLPLISCLGYRPLSDSAVQISLGELISGQPRSWLLEMLVGPRPEGTCRVGRLEVSYDVPGLNLINGKVKTDILVDFTSDALLAKPYDAGVMHIVERLTAFKLQTRAQEEAKMGNVAGASKKMRAAATRLLEMGEEDLAQAALVEAENLERRGQMSSHGSKKLRYETRRLTQRLSP